MTPFAKLGAVLLLLVGLALAGFAAHHFGYASGHADAVSERAASDGLAVMRKTEANVVLVDKQRGINVAIEKAKNAEIAPVIERVYVDRVRIGPASCPAAAGSQADDAAGSDSANSPGRLVRPDVERDTRALDVAVEQDLATGRACQAWGRKNGFVP